MSILSKQRERKPHNVNSPIYKILLHLYKKNMASCLKRILLVFLIAIVSTPLKGLPAYHRLRSKREETLNKARKEFTTSSQNKLAEPNTQKMRRKLSSSFKFLNQSEINKGLDYLKTKYPNVDWSWIFPTSNPGQKRVQEDNSLRQLKKGTSSFTFLNQSEIDKGLDYLKKKYPNVDWSWLFPTINPGRREIEGPKREYHKKSMMRKTSHQQEKSNHAQQPNDIPKTGHGRIKVLHPKNDITITLKVRPEERFEQLRSKYANINDDHERLNG